MPRRSHCPDLVGILEESEYPVRHDVQRGKYLSGEIPAHQEFVVAVPVVGIQSGTRVLQPRLEASVS